MFASSEGRKRSKRREEEAIKIVFILSWKWDLKLGETGEDVLGTGKSLRSVWGLIGIAAWGLGWITVCEGGRNNGKIGEIHGRTKSISSGGGGGEKWREQVQCRTTAMNMFIILVVVMMMMMMMSTIVLEQSERVQDSNWSMPGSRSRPLLTFDCFANIWRAGDFDRLIAVNIFTTIDVWQCSGISVIIDEHFIYQQLLCSSSSYKMLFDPVPSTRSSNDLIGNVLQRNWRRYW